MAKSNAVPFGVTQIKIMMGKEATAKSITLSNTNPATADADGLENADVIVLSGAVTGIYMVKVAGDKAEVLGLDLTAYSGPQNVQYSKAIMSPFCDVTSISVDNGSKSYQDFTTNCDEYPQEEGSVEPGTVSMEINYNHDDAIQQRLEDNFYSDETIFIQAKPKKVNTLKGWSVSVESFNHNGAVKENYKGSVTFKMKSKGQRVEIK